MSHWISLFSQSDFWTNFVASLLATLAGIILGIPVGFALDRRMQSIAREAQVRKDRQHQQQLTKTILNAVHRELRENLDSLLAIQHELPDRVVHLNLVVSSWQTASGIALETVQNFNLIQSIAKIYADFDIIRRDLAAQFEMQFSVMVAMDTYEELRRSLVIETIRRIEIAVPAVKVVLLNIDGYLSELQTAP
jgi:F0F1-type ATP synthase membrane subunit c/vacuolar-type H+-ATPase subunit K